MSSLSIHVGLLCHPLFPLVKSLLTPLRLAILVGFPLALSGCDSTATLPHLGALILPGFHSEPLWCFLPPVPPKSFRVEVHREREEKAEDANRQVNGLASSFSFKGNDPSLFPTVEFDNPLSWATF